MKLRTWKPALLAALVAAPLTALAVDPPLIDCPATSRPGDNIGDEGFYVPTYPGSSLKDLTLYIQFPADGTYTLSMTAKNGGFDGAVIGNANATVDISGDKVQSVTWTFAGNPAVTPGSLVAFEHAKVSGPDGRIFYGVQTLQSACPVIQTNDFTPPLSTYRRNGVAVRINGNLPGNGGYPRTITIPAAASIHGANQTFFHSDLYLFNRYAANLVVTARYRCFGGQSCGTPKTFTVKGYSGLVFADVVASLFGAPETAGAIELSYKNGINDDALHAFSRVYTPTTPDPTNGAAVPGVPAAEATGSSIFVGLGNNGGSRNSGYRTNAGVYNPYGKPAGVIFYLYRNDGDDPIDSKNLIGTYSDTWQPFEAKQVNDIFAAAGAGATVASDVFMVVTSDIPVIPYVTVIDNVTGDSVVQGPKSY